MTRTAAKEGRAKIVMLPELFHTANDERQFQQNAETIPGGQTFTTMSNLAKECNVHLIAGTWPERDTNNAKNLYNTMTVFGPDGRMLARHRKMHLNDGCNTGGNNFNESNSFTRGDEMTTFDACGLKFGLGISNDSLFTELANLYRQRGCDVLVFSNTSQTCDGQRNWDTVFRGRANDNQTYVTAISDAQDRNRNTNNTNQRRTMVVDPWGNVQAQGGNDQEIVYGNIGKCFFFTVF